MRNRNAADAAPALKRTSANLRIATVLEAYSLFPAERSCCVQGLELFISAVYIQHSHDFLQSEKRCYLLFTDWKTTRVNCGCHYFNVYYTCHITAQLTWRRNQHISVNNRWSHNKGSTTRVQRPGSLACLALLCNESFLCVCPGRWWREGRLGISFPCRAPGNQVSLFNGGMWRLT